MEMGAFTIRSDGVIHDLDGVTLHEPTEIWIERITNHQLCFVCGAHQDEKHFNDEHVIPDWVLRRCDLHNQTITLPNGHRVKYSRLKVPCCVECNSLLGKQVETPISELFSLEYDEFCEECGKIENIRLITSWLSLIYFKLHYRNLNVRAAPDRRIDSGNIGDHFPWEQVHHAYTLATSCYTENVVDETTVGTLAILTGITPDGEQTFDFCDHAIMPSIMIQIGPKLIFHNISDAKALSGWLGEQVDKMSAPLDAIQAKELSVDLAYGDFLLINRPTHIVDPLRGRAGKLLLRCQHDAEVTFHDIVSEDRGLLMHAKIGPYASMLVNENRDLQEIDGILKAGKVTFLWDRDGNFTPSPLL